MKNLNLLNKMYEAIEDLGWAIHKFEDPKKDMCDIEIENWSPLGENISEYIQNIQEPSDLIYGLDYVRSSFDVDEHVELWVSNRGKNGVPESISDLVKDAEEIQKMLEQLCHVVDKVYEENI